MLCSAKITGAFWFEIGIGMWGAKIWQRRDLVEGLMRALVVSGQQQIKSQDQISLADIVWPIAKYDVVIIDLLKFAIFISEQFFFIEHRWPMTLTDAKTRG
jgi:hypothetical protein